MRSELKIKLNCHKIIILSYLYHSVNTKWKPEALINITISSARVTGFWRGSHWTSWLLTRFITLILFLKTLYSFLLYLINIFFYWIEQYKVFFFYYCNKTVLLVHANLERNVWRLILFFLIHTLLTNICRMMIWEFW